jgi:anti-anti-sigma factor
MRISERQFGDIAVLDLAGPIAGEAAARSVDEAVGRQIRERRNMVVANLADVPSVDLRGLGALLNAYSQMRNAGGVIRLAGLTGRIHDLIAITRLVTLFDTFDSVEEAVGGPVPAYAASSKSAQPAMAATWAIPRFLRRA